MRRGAAWARQAVVTSAAVGFASFFLFLGFGYFDPLHAYVSVVAPKNLKMLTNVDPASIARS